jgi:hypothetical protein
MAETWIIRDGLVYREWPDDHEHIRNLADVIDGLHADVIDGLKRAWRAEEALELCRKALKVG